MNFDITIEDILYDCLEENNFEKFHKFFNENSTNVIPNIFKNEEQQIYFIIFALDDKDYRFITTIMEHPEFDVSYNNYEPIETICQVEYFLPDFKYDKSIIFNVLSLPNVYNNLSESYINEKLLDYKDKPFAREVYNIFKSNKIYKKIGVF